MLNLWYQDALLFWYCFFNLFTVTISRRIKSLKFRNEVRRPEGKPIRMKNEELSASPIKKQGSAAGGKANYRIENSKSQRSENNSKL